MAERREKVWTPAGAHSPPADLRAFGEANEREAPSREQTMLHITPATGLFWWRPMRAWRPRHLVDVGLSTGYCALRLADALPCPKTRRRTRRSSVLGISRPIAV
jgi:predicted O-methyltransferase YrrM